MDLRPIDRRGLGEIVAWASSLGCVTLLLIATLVRTGNLDATLLGLLGGLVTATLARGAQSASERSAREDLARQLDESARAAAETAKRFAERAETAVRQLDEHRPPPATDATDKK
jgi:hypothetical protein